MFVFDTWPPTKGHVRLTRLAIEKLDEEDQPLSGPDNYGDPCYAKPFARELGEWLASCLADNGCSLGQITEIANEIQHSDACDALTGFVENWYGFLSSVAINAPIEISARDRS